MKTVIRKENHVVQNIGHVLLNTVSVIFDCLIIAYNIIICHRGILYVHILLYNLQFDGAPGELFQKSAITFCAKQQIALESLREKRKRDTKLNIFLTEAEGNPVCKRLQLKDILPTGMIR